MHEGLKPIQGIVGSKTQRHVSRRHELVPIKRPIWIKHDPWKQKEFQQGNTV